MQSQPREKPASGCTYLKANFTPDLGPRFPTQFPYTLHAHTHPDAASFTMLRQGLMKTPYVMSNPWLGGKTVLQRATILARSISTTVPGYTTAPMRSCALKSTRPLFMRATEPLQFSATKPNQDFITAFFTQGVIFPFIPLHMALFQGTTWLIGQTYNILPWVLLLFLVVFILLYGCRLADYDRGQMLNLRSTYTSDNTNILDAPIAHDTRTWRNLADHFFSVTHEEAETLDNWTVAKDGSVEPSSSYFGPSALAAFHAVNGMSLRWDLITYVADWNESWCRRSYVQTHPWCVYPRTHRHLLLIQPTWLIGGGKDVHARLRTEVGDWTYVKRVFPHIVLTFPFHPHSDEYFPWSRSMSTLSFPYANAS